MAKSGLMYTCEVQRPFRTPEGSAELRWVERSATQLARGDSLRCQHCHGPVRLHKQREPHGPADHVEHLSGPEVKNCQAGSGFKVKSQQHPMSASPVT